VSQSVAAIALLVADGAFLVFFWLAPGGVLALRRRAGGAIQPDARLGYGPRTLYALLDAYGQEGRRGYRRMLLVDTAFPIVYGGTLFHFAAALAAGRPGLAPAAAIVRCAATAAAAFDYGENVLLLTVLGRYPARALAIARAAGLCTSAKFLGVALAFLALAAEAMA
jgi:hypothetical protein